MSEGFWGTVFIGGRITEKQFAKCKEIVDELKEFEEGLEFDGSCTFCDRHSNDFEELIKYCKANNIALSIDWERNSAFNSSVQYWVNGKESHFNTDDYGDIVIRLDHLKENGRLSCEEYVSKLDIPDFPNLEIIEEPNSMRCVTVYLSDGDTIVTSINGTDEEIERHYLGQPFESSDEKTTRIALCVHFHDNDRRSGLKIKNIESGAIRKILDVRVEDEDGGRKCVWLKVSDTEYDLYDVWVYGRDDRWIKGIGYPHPTAE